MPTGKIFSITLLTLMFSGFCLVDGPMAASSQVHAYSPSTSAASSRTIGAHFTTQAELRAMQPGRFPLAPAQQDTLREFLRTANRGQWVVCDSHVVGSIRVTQGDQTCTFVVCQVECGGNSAQVTIQDCFINT